MKGLWLGSGDLHLEREVKILSKSQPNGIHSLYALSVAKFTAN